MQVTLLLQARVEYRLLHYASRALYGQLLVGGVTYVALLPALSVPTEEEEALTSAAAHAADLRFFAASWEPPGRDRIALLRLDAMRFGRRGPCLWLRLAELERVVHFDLEAARDEERADGASAADCKRPLF